MSEPKRALMLHLAGREPLLIAVSGEAADELAGSLAALLRKGDVETITAANGSAIAVNFAHVLAAHVDVVTGLAQLYGSPPRER